MIKLVMKSRRKEEVDVFKRQDILIEIYTKEQSQIIILLLLCFLFDLSDRFHLFRGPSASLQHCLLGIAYDSGSGS